MIYEYECEKCDLVFEVEKSMKDDIPKTMKCPSCKGQCPRIWSNMSIHIPEFMRASSKLYNSDSGNNADYIKGRMTKGVRPSGKSKTYF